VDAEDAPLIPPYLFGTDRFLSDNEPFVNAYVLKRVMGVHPKRAMRDVFGAVNDDNDVMTRVAQLESTNMYQRKFDAKLASIPMSDLWRDRKAVHRLLELVESPYTKENVKRAAIADLNVLCGITVVDERGVMRKVGLTLDEFYRTHETRDKPAPANEAMSEADNARRVTH
jgi:hypothetical protein